MKMGLLFIPPPHLWEIYSTSTASYAENKCSTYQRYACALFSANSLYLYRLFPKGFFSQYTAHPRLALLNHNKFAYSLAFLLKEINSS